MNGYNPDYIKGKWPTAQAVDARFNGGASIGIASFGGYKQLGNVCDNDIFGFGKFLEFKSLQFKVP